VAVAAKYSFITETATMTIHPLRLNGFVIGVPQTWEYLEKMQDRVVRFVVSRSRVEEWRFREMMFRSGELARDVGTVLIGREAVECGLIDEVGGIAQAISKLREMAAENQKEDQVQ
jgi:ATP-dependent protease ClpP protease subunit